MRATPSLLVARVLLFESCRYGFKGTENKLDLNIGPGTDMNNFRYFKGGSLVSLFVVVVVVVLLLFVSLFVVVVFTCFLFVFVTTKMGSKFPLLEYAGARPSQPVVVLLGSIVYCCFQLFLVVFNCFPVVFNCFLLFSIVSCCFQVFPDVFKWFLLFSSVSCCFQVFSADFNS